MALKQSLLFVLLALGTRGFSQDQLLFVNGGHQYVDSIDTLDSVLLYYVLDNKEASLPLRLLSGFYMTIKTRKNLSRKFRKRKRIHYSVENEEHSIPSNEEFLSLYINARTPENLAEMEYEAGFYVTKKGNKVDCKIARLPRADHALYCIVYDHDNSYMLLTADKIKSYAIGNRLFKSLSIRNQDGTLIHQFVEGKVTGKLNYFEKISTPVHSYGFAMIYKENENKIYPYFKPGQTMISFEESQYLLAFEMSRYGVRGLRSIPENLNTNYAEIMSSLISDCPSMKFKFEEGFYTEHDLISLLVEYNSCNFLDNDN